MRRLFLGFALLGVMMVAGCSAWPPAHDPTTRPLRDTAKSVAILVSAHPDDEMQMWSLVEADRTAWPIFVFLNRGESTAACNNRSSTIGDFETQTFEDGERGPDPVPAGNFTPACSQARVNSTLEFLALMSEADPHFPGQWVPKTINTVDGWPREWCKHNPAKNQCLPVDHKPLVWIDAQFRGAAVFFDAGDFDVTAEEAAWAVNAVIDHRKEWGMSWAPISIMASNYTNGRGECIIYDHPDHDAVQRGVAQVVAERDDLDQEVLALATCSSDPHITRRYRLSDLAIRAAFGLEGAGDQASGHTDDAGAATITGTITGAHGLAYGWLWPGHFPLGRTGQTALFHADQTFANQPGDLRPAPDHEIVLPEPTPSAPPLFGELGGEEAFDKDAPAVAPTPLAPDEPALIPVIETPGPDDLSREDPLATATPTPGGG